VEGPLAALWREVAARPRTVYEIQQVLPGADPDEPWSDPVLRAAELHDGGEREEARDALMILLHQDLRCLDAHAHLGNWSFSEYSLDTALAHYEVGVRIGEQSIGASAQRSTAYFRGVTSTIGRFSVASTAMPSHSGASSASRKRWPLSNGYFASIPRTTRTLV